MKKTSVKRFKKYVKYLGFLGFMGFFGFAYFINHNISSIFLFGFFGFFSFFFTGNLIEQMPDERLIENNIRARANVFLVPTLSLFLIGKILGGPYGTDVVIAIVVTLGYTLTFLTYSILLFYYEKH